jgi:hypothetical protein
MAPVTWLAIAIVAAQGNPVGRYSGCQATGGDLLWQHHHVAPPGLAIG